MRLAAPLAMVVFVNDTTLLLLFAACTFYRLHACSLLHFSCTSAEVLVKVFMVEPSHTTGRIHQLIQQALQANKQHQQALNDYIAKLEAELRTVERLIVRLPVHLGSFF